MKNKILVFVVVPAIEKEFNVYIPITKKIGTVKNLIISAVEEQSNGVFINNHCKKLYDKESGNILDDQQYVKYSSIRNGTKLILL